MISNWATSDAAAASWLADSNAIRRAMTSAGWQLASFNDRGWVVAGEPVDVTTCGAKRDGLHAAIVVLRGSVDGDFADRTMGLSHAPCVAKRRAGFTKVAVEVRDARRACEELERLDGAATFDELVLAAEARGWTIDPRASRDDTSDFTWTVAAKRPGEALSFHRSFGAAVDPRPLHVDDTGHAWLHRAGGSVRVTVSSAREAERLAGLLEGRSA